MADLREKIVSRKQCSFVMNSRGTMHGVGEENYRDCHLGRGHSYPFQDVQGAGSRVRRKVGSGEIHSDNALCHKVASNSFKSASFSFSSSDNDIDIRNDPEFRFGCGNRNTENTEKVYEIAKERCQKYKRMNLTLVCI